MADDDKLDFDDEMDLSADSDDLDLGDDFAGALDDVMEDSVRKDDSSDDLDSELDSFFGSLPSIEETDKDDKGGAAEEKPFPATPTAAPIVQKVKAEKSGGKLKWVILLLVVLLVGGGSSWWFFFKGSGTGDVPAEEGFEEMTEQPEPEDPVITQETKQVIALEQKPKTKQPAPKFEPASVGVPKSQKEVPQAKYYIQVANCLFTMCLEAYRGKLREIGEPIFQKEKKQKLDFIELISKQAYSLHRANYLVKLINRSNKGAGNASVVDQSNGHRVTMGVFTALDRAQETKFYLEKEFSSEELVFNLERVKKDYQTTRVYAGPYRSRNEAKKKLRDLSRDRIFTGSFIVSY